MSYRHGSKKDTKIENVHNKIDSVEQSLGQRIDRLDEKIDGLQVEFQKYTRWLTGYALSGTGILLVILIKLIFFPA